MMFPHHCDCEHFKAMYPKILGNLIIAQVSPIEFSKVYLERINVHPLGIAIFKTSEISYTPK